MDAQQWLERHFGCRLNDEQLLKLALSHRSVGRINNERLEFLGDAALGLVISETLYKRFPDADEGYLSRLRVSIVKGKSLASLAAEIGLSDLVILGAGESHGGGRHRESILADTFEALLGAILLDRGFTQCESAVLMVFETRLDSLKLEQARKDPKTRLQEFLQGRRRQLPVYELMREYGPDHARSFDVICRLEDGKESSVGKGSSRRAAEQAAAESVLALLEQS